MKAASLNADATVSGSFYPFCVATFLSFLGTSSISYFSVVLAREGMTQQQIGTVFSSALLPVVLGIVLCGELMKRFTSLEIAIAGQLITLLAFTSFLVTVADPFGAVVSRFLVGCGFGLFFPGALVYARTLIQGPASVFLFRIYSTMIPLPNFVGPGLAELIFGAFGTSIMLAAFTLPILAGLLISLFLARPPRAALSTVNPTYREIAFSRATVTPNLAITFVGLMWGFMLSFMALYLNRAGIHATMFFSSATGAMVVSRFTLMAWLGKQPRHAVVGLGLILMAIGYAALPFAASSVAMVTASAAVFGLGYSTAFPVLSLWATDRFPVAQRGRPMAVFTAIFQASIYVVPFLVGHLGGLLGMDGWLLLLAAASALFGLSLWAWPSPSRR